MPVARKAKSKPRHSSARAEARTVLIDRLDECFFKSIEPKLETKLRMVVSAAWANDEVDTREQVRGFVLAAFQEIQLALFPESFEDDPECEAAKEGLLPSSLKISHIGLERLVADIFPDEED